MKKFRIWDRRFNRMQYEFKIVNDGFYVPENPSVVEHLGISDIYVKFDNGNFELMQWTGLKDKNYKDIFEGDIIRNSFGIGVIEFRACCFVINYFDESKGIFLADYFNGVKVLGNIYENKLEDFK